MKCSCTRNWQHPERRTPQRRKLRDQEVAPNCCILRRLLGFTNRARGDSPVSSKSMQQPYITYARRKLCAVSPRYCNPSFLWKTKTTDGWTLSALAESRNCLRVSYMLNHLFLLSRTGQDPVMSFLIQLGRIDTVKSLDPHINIESCLELAKHCYYHSHCEQPHPHNPFET